MLHRLVRPVAAGAAATACAAALGGAPVLVAGAASAAPQALITNLSVKDTAHASAWSVQAGLNRGSRIYADRAYTFTSVPATLTGAAWIQTAGASKTFKGS